jgi:tetratricopeptide (TPR) repeat protein
MLVAVKSLIAYLWKMMLPTHLIPYYPYPKDVSLFSAQYIPAILLAAVITAVCILMAKKQRLLLSAWTYYLVTLLPVLGLVQVGGQSMADRYTYLPSLAPFLLFGVLSAQLACMTNSVKHGELGVKLFGITVAVFILLSLSALTYKQVQIWKNSFTLWTYVIEKEPARIPVAYNNRGLAFFTMGETDRAIEDYHQAIAMDPQHAEAHSNLGVALFKKGLVNEAIREFQIAIRFSPGLVNAHRNLAPALYRSGRIEEALEQYLIVTRLRPDDASAHADLGAAYGAMGSYNKAIEHFQIAIRLRPDFADAHYNLGIAYQTKGLMDQAIEHLEAAARLNPADAVIRNDLARAYSLRNSGSP